MGDELSGQQLARISDGVTKVWARLHGRGPVEARSYAVDSYVFTVLEGGLSTQELTLVGRGRADLVRQVRTVFEEEIRDEMVALVEETTGREVADYASQFLSEAGITVEVFALRRGGEDR